MKRLSRDEGLSLERCSAALEPASDALALERLAVQYAVETETVCTLVVLIRGC
jgi:hypothetical protein